MPIRYADEIVVAYILSFLDKISVLRFGMTSRMHRIVSRHAVLWGDLNLSCRSIGIDAISELVSRSSHETPLRRLHISCHNRNTAMTVVQGHQQAMESLTGAPFKVLVVDHSEQSCLQTCQALEPMRFATEFVANGTAALGQMQRNQYDLVLMEVNLPDMDGIAVTRALRHFETVIKRDFSQRIVGLSDDVSEDTKRLALDAGMNDFLTKPFDLAVHSIRLLDGSDQQCCNSCGFLLKLKKEGKLCSLQDVGLTKAYWLSPCALQTMLSACEQLRTIDIAHNIDVNQLVSCLSTYCPQLESFSFTYLQKMYPGDVLYNRQRRLQQKIALKWVSSCPKLRVVRLRHCAVDESTAADLLGFQCIEEADFSDNESILGYFLELIPFNWPNLKSLALRDCTELQDENVLIMVKLLMNGGCPNLSYIDLSCQWSFYCDSLLEATVKDELLLARPLLTWREDQCEFSGTFGIDPNAGIDSVSNFDEDACNVDDLGSDDGQTDCDMSTGTVDPGDKHHIDRNTVCLGKVFGGSRLGSSFGFDRASDSSVACSSSAPNVGTSRQFKDISPDSVDGAGSSSKRQCT